MSKRRRSRLVKGPRGGKSTALATGTTAGLSSVAPSEAGRTRYDLMAGGVPPTVISDVNPGSNTWSPSQPVAPFGPPSVDYPRAYDYQVGTNLDFASQGRLPFFKMLQVLSRSWGILRTVIETRKDQLIRIPWDVQLVDKPDQTDKRVDEVRSFLKRPDRQHTFGAWMRLQLEDLLVIDAANYYVWKNQGGKPYAAMHIAGETIKPLVDDAGRQPEWPNPAWQQVIKGLPWQNLDAGEFVYAPMRPTPQEPVYGYSPVQQIYTEVLQGIKKQLYKLSYWDDGSIPQLMVTVPSGWTPEQVAAFQAHFDVMMSGNVPFKSRVRFMPSDMKPFDLKNANGELLKTEEDEWVTKLVCYAFSVSATPFISQVNRATAQSAQEQAQEEGLHPLMTWVKEDLIDPLIQRPGLGFGYEDIEFIWDPEPEVDTQKQMTVVTGYVKDGLMTPDEGREQINLPPLPDGAGAKAVVITPAGPIPFAETIEANTAAAKFKTQNPGGPPAPQPPGERAPPSDGGAPPTGGTKPKPPKKDDAEVGKVSRAPFRGPPRAVRLRKGYGAEAVAAHRSRTDGAARGCQDHQPGEGRRARRFEEVR